jgi:hypothetical protein
MESSWIPFWVGSTWESCFSKLASSILADSVDVGADVGDAAAEDVGDVATTVGDVAAAVGNVNAANVSPCCSILLAPFCSLCPRRQLLSSSCLFQSHDSGRINIF